MEEVKYIPGDLVMTNGVPLGTAQNVVYRVTSSDPSKTLKLGDGTVLKGVVRLENIEGAEFGDKGYLLAECCAWVKDIVPIPLTSAILEKNGWKIPYDEGFYCSPNKKGISVFLPYRFIGTVQNVYTAHIHLLRSNINSVSDLQHLLFGLGINHEMEM